jgi:hypothetical protein
MNQGASAPTPLDVEGDLTRIGSVEPPGPIDAPPPMMAMAMCSFVFDRENIRDCSRNVDPSFGRAVLFRLLLPVFALCKSKQRAMKQGWSLAGSRAIYHRLDRLDLGLGQRLFEYLDCAAYPQLCLAPVVLRLLQFGHAFHAGLVFGLEGGEAVSRSWDEREN